MLRVKAPMVLPDMVLAVSGSCEALGNWDPAKALVFNSADFPEWSLQIPLAGLPEEFDYKLLLLRKSDRQTLAWERRDNRRLSIPRFDDNSSMCVTGLYCENPLPNWRGAGVAIPVFSLRTRHDFGVGDFFDLMPLIDWAASTGQRFIQLLPINDTTMTGTWTDSYPYNANSTFALHPMYLRVQDLGELSASRRWDSSTTCICSQSSTPSARSSTSSTPLTTSVSTPQSANIPSPSSASRATPR